MKSKEVGMMCKAVVLMLLVSLVTLGLAGCASAQEVGDELRSTGIGSGGLLFAFALGLILLGILAIIVAIISLFTPIPLARIVALIIGFIGGLAIVAGVFVLILQGVIF